MLYVCISRKYLCYRNSPGTQGHKQWRIPLQNHSLHNVSEFTQPRPRVGFAFGLNFMVAIKNKSIDSVGGGEGWENIFFTYRKLHNSTPNTVRTRIKTPEIFRFTLILFLYIRDFCKVNLEMFLRCWEFFPLLPIYAMGMNNNNMKPKPKLNFSKFLNTHLQKLGMTSL